MVFIFFVPEAMKCWMDSSSSEIRPVRTWHVLAVCCVGVEWYHAWKHEVWRGW